ncbi:methionine import ATP-binding protein MetN 1 [Kurthia zopfii]|uniref:D-methionine transport system ATP-binding protein n=1 Tax=Kurthia zopfii TaxID=1650 RepID=A0A8B4Q3Z2_9BACL|nr:ATP-binding cassette domain-containing protein [Kurthia zopfii]TDR33698.1 D-methionine transport system ATP-binding protein [Kurthia zopfii]GEK32037.1 methionine import ATP-binding protein MetN 1 [Kurthia zopfii]STX08592.1 Methionine import ATP-binding protein MetN 2 [Kurthia zopfii]
MIELKNVRKSFFSNKQEITAVDGVNMTINAGEIHGVIGYSGAGKSTLIRCVNLLETPTEGEVLINGKNLLKLSSSELREVRSKVGMIFQHFNLLKTVTVYENIAIPLKLSGVPKSELKERVEKYLKIVGLEDRASNYPSQLSGGQKQRVAIARALSLEPTILLSDEATSALDPETTESILDLLLKINRELGITILLITHEMNVIQKICDHVYVMENGSVVEQGSTIDLFTSPQHSTTQKFLNTISQRQLSDSLVESLNVTGAVTRLTFVGAATGKPALAEVSKKFSVTPNILTANIIELKNGIVGNIVVHLEGDKNAILDALKYLEQSGIRIEQLGGRQA